MKKLFITLCGVVLIGGAGYVGYEHMKPASHFDKDIQVAPTSSSSSDDLDVSEKRSGESSEQGAVNNQQSGKNDSYNKGYAAGVEIGKEDNRVGYIGQATPGATTDEEFVRGWTDGRQATDKPGLKEQRSDDSSQGVNPTAEEQLDSMASDPSSHPTTQQIELMTPQQKQIFEKSHNIK